MANLIQPRLLKGFRDYLPSAMMAREQIMEIARRVYRSYGFAPIDTPAMEYAEILLGKGSDETDKQLFRFRDHGDRDVALRFDLTVPLARFVSQHFAELGVPFKRYHLAPVWRGENTQRGRYREFMQCDFDIIGVDSNQADIEILLVINDLFTAIGVDQFTIRVNNRKLLNGLLQSIGVADRAVGVLRAIDKLAKIGVDGVRQELMQQAQLTEAQAVRVLELTQTGIDLDVINAALADNTLGRQGVADLRQLFAVARDAGLPEGRLALDVSIARGLDYYTGTIFETFLDALPGIGSVCSGGRYDNLAELFTKEQLPGVGASLGLDRLLAALEELKLLKETASPAKVLVTVFSPNQMSESICLGRTLRAAGIAAEVFPDARAIGKQFKYADRKGFHVALVRGPDDAAKQVWQVKSLKEGTQREVRESDVTAAVLANLGALN